MITSLQKKDSRFIKKIYNVVISFFNWLPINYQWERGPGPGILRSLMGGSGKFHGETTKNSSPPSPEKIVTGLQYFFLLLKSKSNPLYWQPATFNLLAQFGQSSDSPFCASISDFLDDLFHLFGLNSQTTLQACAQKIITSIFRIIAQVIKRTRACWLVVNHHVMSFIHNLIHLQLDWSPIISQTELDLTLSLDIHGSSVRVPAS